MVCCAVESSRCLPRLCVLLARSVFFVDVWANFLRYFFLNGALEMLNAQYQTKTRSARKYTRTEKLHVRDAFTNANVTKAWIEYIKFGHFSLSANIIRMPKNNLSHNYRKKIYTQQQQQKRRMKMRPITHSNRSKSKHKYARPLSQSHTHLMDLFGQLTFSYWWF